MIYTFIAYAPKEHDKDLAWAYNECMRLLPNDDDWACFLDHDAMFTTPDWYHQLVEIVKQNPQYSCLVGATNRVAATWQIPTGVNSINHDMNYHRKIGAGLQRVNYSRVVDVTTPPSIPFSGVIFLYKKSAWKQQSFEPYGPKRITGVDNLLHTNLRKINHKVGLMTGIYVYHWYRAGVMSAPPQPSETPVPAKSPKPETNESDNEKVVVPYDRGYVEVNVDKKAKDQIGMDVEAAQAKIKKCNGGNFIIVGAPIAYDRQIDLATCLWIEHQKRKPNVMALYETSRFASFGRNNVIHKTLEYLPGVTHVFFIDKDVLPPVDAMEKLLAHDKDIIVGATPIYKDGPVWSVMKYDPDETVDNNFKPIPYAELPDKLFRAHHFGGTTVLIKRHVLEEMKYPWYQDVFAPGTLLLGQDLFFTAKAKQCDFELWCDPTIRCQHTRQCELMTVFDKCCLPNKEPANVS